MAVCETVNKYLQPKTRRRTGFSIHQPNSFRNLVCVCVHLFRALQQHNFSLYFRHETQESNAIWVRRGMCRAQQATDIIQFKRAREREQNIRISHSFECLSTSTVIVCHERSFGCSIDENKFKLHNKVQFTRGKKTYWQLKCSVNVDHLSTERLIHWPGFFLVPICAIVI